MRSYRYDDLCWLHEAVRNLHEHVVALDRVGRLRVTEQYAAHATKKLLRDVRVQNGCLLIGCDDGAPPGLPRAWSPASHRPALLGVQPSRLGVVTDLHVNEPWRKRGLGADLLSGVEEHLLGVGCDALWVTVLAFNAVACQMYETRGYAPREIGMLKSVASGPES